MELQTTIYIFVGLSFALYLGIAYWARAGSTSEFYVAGGGVHPIANGMATAADWMSAASFISMAGLIANLGYGGAVFLMGWTGGYVLLAMLLAPYLRKFGKFTVPEFIGDRFYSKTARNVGVLCLLVASLTYIIGQMTGVGVTFARFLGVTSDQGIYIGMAIVFMYAVFGGMKGITYTQVAQYCVLIAAYLVPAFFISMNLTDSFLPQVGLGANMAGTDVSLLNKLDQVVTELGFSEYTTTANGSMLNMFFYTVSLMIGTAGLPHVIVRFFTVPKVADARSSAGWALVFIALLYTTAPAVGAMAKLNLHGTMNSAVGLITGPAGQLRVNPDAVKANGDLYATEASLVYEQRPEWMKRWEKTGLLKWEDKNGDGRVQYYNDKSKNEAAIGKAEAAGWKGNELTVNADIIVLANPEIATLPNWVIALVAAGGLAAALSTAAGLLLAISSAISHDLIKGAINPNISEKNELMAGKISMGVAVFVAGYLGLNPPGFAAGTVALAFGIAASTIFPALMMGIFSKTVSDKGAIAGMLSGLFVTLFYVFAHKGLFFVKGTDFVDMVGGVNGFFGIAPEAFGTVGAIVNFAVAYLVSKMGAPVPKHIQELVESVRVPKGAGMVSGGH
ncbi:sodium:solute symporter family protein [Hydrogenophaga sp. PAMC20947]|uniref:sodium:solute symporter family protein n=1 Tax=Hydrogenophaga sp. PAMC20947 TaxID=2565558 RepID=UPI00109DC31A|nr:sodium:solute symporter family protein [Hydrogenophaga sp. PAMC20947]QCB45825.1 cation acetate symporter [Hydrogenophaga sp. PAMC20947]